MTPTDGGAWVAFGLVLVLVLSIVGLLLEWLAER